MMSLLVVGGGGSGFWFWSWTWIWFWIWSAAAVNVEFTLETHPWSPLPADLFVGLYCQQQPPFPSTLSGLLELVANHTRSVCPCSPIALLLKSNQTEPQCEKDLSRSNAWNCLESSTSSALMLSYPSPFSRIDDSGSQILSPSRMPLLLCLMSSMSEYFLRPAPYGFDVRTLGSQVLAHAQSSSSSLSSSSKVFPRHNVSQSVYNLAASVAQYSLSIESAYVHVDQLLQDVCAYALDLQYKLKLSSRLPFASSSDSVLDLLGQVMWFALANSVSSRNFGSVNTQKLIGVMGIVDSLQLSIEPYYRSMATKYGPFVATDDLRFHSHLLGLLGLNRSTNHTTFVPLHATNDVVCPAPDLIHHDEIDSGQDVSSMDWLMWSFGQMMHPESFVPHRKYMNILEREGHRTLRQNWTLQNMMRYPSEAVELSRSCVLNNDQVAHQYDCVTLGQTCAPTANHSTDNSSNNNNNNNSATLLIFRIIGDDLMMRHGSNQSLANLEFVLKHESRPLAFPGVHRKWLINKFWDQEKETAAIRMLQQHGEWYMRIPLNITQWGTDFLMGFGLQSAIGVNEARNVALLMGEKMGYRFVLPLDGGCFLTEVALADIMRALTHPTHSLCPLLSVPLYRVDSNDVVFSDLHRLNNLTHIREHYSPQLGAQSDPQFIVVNCRKYPIPLFKTHFLYSQRSKDYLITLWKNENVAPELCFAPVGYVVRLHSGSALDKHSSMHMAEWNRTRNFTVPTNGVDVPFTYNYGLNVLRLKGQDQLLNMLWQRAKLLPHFQHLQHRFNSPEAFSQMRIAEHLVSSLLSLVTSTSTTSIKKHQHHHDQVL